MSQIFSIASSSVANNLRLWLRKHLTFKKMSVCFLKPIDQIFFKTENYISFIKI